MINLTSDNKLTYIGRVRTYNSDRVTSSNGYYISTWDYSGANCLHLRLDGINDFIASQRIIVRWCSLLWGRAIK